MINNTENHRFIALGLAVAFLVNSIGPASWAEAEDFVLPQPGTMVSLSPAFVPPILKGIKVHPDNPFYFDFILDQGDNSLPPAGRAREGGLKEQATRLIKYFLAGLTIPEKDLWVNLSPYEKDRIVPQAFGQTVMGRDLLAEDYLLKQITASLIYPERQTGRRFWQRIYSKAAKRFGTTNIPVNTFNKVWIVPEKAVVYENAKALTAYVVESKLKVMLEQDYLSLQKHEGIQEHVGRCVSDGFSTNTLGNQVVREILIPELSKEVNEDRNFSQLRQVYNSLILATWYKKKIKDSILERVYADRNKVTGVNIADPHEKQRIYERYLKAFKKGVFNYIKETRTPGGAGTGMPRKYFSGGFGFNDLAMRIEIENTFTQSVLNNSQLLDLTAGLVNARGVNSDAAMNALPMGKLVSDAVSVSNLATVRNNDEAMMNWERVSLNNLLKTEETFMDHENAAHDQRHLQGQVVKKIGIINNWTGKRGDVYKAKTKDGQVIAVKVQKIRPFGYSFLLQGTKSHMLQMELYGGPKYYGSVRINIGGRMRVGLAMEALDGVNLRDYLKSINPSYRITEDHIKSLKNLRETLYQHNLGLTDLKIDNLMIAPRSPIRPIDMGIVNGDQIGNRNTKATIKDTTYHDFSSIIEWLERKKAETEKSGFIKRIFRRVFKGKQIRIDLKTEVIDSAMIVSKKESPVPEGVLRVQHADILEKLERMRIRDHAMRSKGNEIQPKKVPGGIDLTPANKVLQIQKAGYAIKFHFNPAQLAQLQNAPGFVPVIIDIQPIHDLRLWLGI